MYRHQHESCNTGSHSKGQRAQKIAARQGMQETAPHPAGPQLLLPAGSGSDAINSELVRIIAPRMRLRI
jgi:hypothetical protein